jgi:hypothetical protein
VNVEAIAMNKDHISMAKFVSSEDADFQAICGHLGYMVKKAPHKIADRWKHWKRVDGAYLTHKMNIILIGYINSEIDSRAQPCVPYHMTPHPSDLFTGREDYLEKLRQYFILKLDQTHPIQKFLLYGLGGTGKTQICLKFAEESSEQ